MAERNVWYIKDQTITKTTLYIPWGNSHGTKNKDMTKSEMVKLSLDNLHRMVSVRLHVLALDVSTASRQKLGRELSAFNLTIGGRPVESLYQGSKVFVNNMQYTELYDYTPVEAKKYIGLKASYPIEEFKLDGITYPAEPTTLFFDWLYLRGVCAKYGSRLDLYNYDAFTDIQSSVTGIACQARSVAIYKLLQLQGRLGIVNDFNKFKEWHIQYVEDTEELPEEYESVECLYTCEDYSIDVSTWMPEVFEKMVSGSKDWVLTVIQGFYITANETVTEDWLVEKLKNL